MAVVKVRALRMTSTLRAIMFCMASGLLGFSSVYSLHQPGVVELGQCLWPMADCVSRPVQLTHDASVVQFLSESFIEVFCCVE